MHLVGLIRQLGGLKAVRNTPEAARGLRGGAAKGEAITRLKQVNFSFKWANSILRLHKFTLKVEWASLRLKGQTLG